MEWLQAVSGLLAVMVALPAIYYAAKAAKYARDTVVITALESDLRLIDEAHDRMDRLDQRLRDYVVAVRRHENPDLRKTLGDADGEWQNAFIRLPAWAAEELWIDDAYRDGQKAIPLTGAEGWILDDGSLDSLRALTDAAIRTGNGLMDARHKVDKQRQAILDRLTG